MKKAIAYPAALVIFSIVLLACSKNAADNLSRPTTTPDRIISAKIAPGQTYIVDVALRGELGILRQAAHYSLSETGISDKNGYLVYKYIPADGFAGTDEVMLSHKTEATGDNYGACNYGGSQMTNNSAIIAVKITVAQ